VVQSASNLSRALLFVGATRSKFPRGRVGDHHHGPRDEVRSPVDGIDAAEAHAGQGCQGRDQQRSAVWDEGHQIAGLGRLLSIAHPGSPGGRVAQPAPVLRRDVVLGTDVDVHPPSRGAGDVRRVRLVWTRAGRGFCADRAGAVRHLAVPPGHAAAR